MTRRELRRLIGSAIVVRRQTDQYAEPVAVALHPSTWEDVLLDVDPRDAFAGLDVTIPPPPAAPRFRGIPVLQDPRLGREEVVVQWPADG